MSQEETSNTRELFRLTEIFSTCQAMKSQLQRKLGEDASELFFLSCTSTLPMMREQDKNYETNLNKTAKTDDGSCLVGLDIITKRNVSLDPENYSMYGFNQKFMNDEAWSQQTFTKMADCFAKDQRVVEGIQKKHQFLHSVAKNGLSGLMPSFTKKLKELSAANGGPKDSTSVSETAQLFETYSKDAQDRFVACLKQQREAALKIPSEEARIVYATEQCGIASFENFFKGMILSCHKSINDCATQTKAASLENENTFGVLACVSELQDRLQSNEDSCAKLAVLHIDNMSRKLLE